MAESNIASADPMAVKKIQGQGAAEHPRQHALTMAAASHLHAAGHISDEHRSKIERHARAKLDAHKAKKKLPPHAPFGSLAPSGAGHYIATVNPGAVNPPMSPPTGTNEP